MKTIIRAGALALGLSIIGLGQASAQLHTRVCVKIGDWTDAGSDTSGDVFAKLTGVGGDTIKIDLDEPGRDDLNRNTWNCYDRSTSNGFNRVPDVGIAALLKIETNGVEDDFCVIQAYSERWNGKPGQGARLSHTDFLLPGRDGSVCFGNESQSVREKTFRRYGNVPPNTKIKTKGYWVRKDSHIGDRFEFAHTASVTKGSSTTNTSAWSLAVERGLEIETGFATNSLNITATTTEEQSITDFNERNLTSTITKACSAQGLGGGNQEMVYWVWNVDIPQQIGSGTKLVTRHSACMIDPPGANLKPACRPGCIDAASDITLQTCKKSQECNVRLN